MRWVRLALVLSLALTGCATTPPVSQQPLGADQQRSLLQELATFSFAGRVAISGQDSSPSMKWEQQHDATKVSLSSPMGLGGGLQVEYSPGQLRLVTSRGERLEGGEAEQALADALGFVPPFDSLRYWILGVPAPGAAAPIASFDADGLMQQLQQQGWTIGYVRRMAVKTAAGALQLPAKLVATRDNLRLTLVIDRWLMK